MAQSQSGQDSATHSAALTTDTDTHMSVEFMFHYRQVIPFEFASQSVHSLDNIDRTSNVKQTLATHCTVHAVDAYAEEINELILINNHPLLPC